VGFAKYLHDGCQMNNDVEINMKLINLHITGSTNNFNRLGVAVLLTIATGATWAGDETGWYGGANIGQSRAHIDDNRITQNLLGAGATATSINNDDQETAYKIFGGYQFNRYFALESGYFNLGNFGFKATTVPSGTLQGGMKLQGIDIIDAVGIYPFTKKLSAFGRIGVNYAEAKDSFSGTGAVTVLDAHPNGWDTNYKAGFGLQYAFTSSFGIRTEFERYRINDVVGHRGDVDLLSVGLVYRFGDKSHRAIAEAQAPVAKIETVPELVVVPVVVMTAQYCSILDIQYEINQDEIQPEEKEKLAVVGTFLNKYPDTSGVIEGHADNVGSDKDNMKLSQRRADAVVNYLEENFHIAPSRLKAVGYGETHPLASNDTQEGKRTNRSIDAVIACATDIEGLEPVAGRITMAMEMEFDTNKADIRPQYHDELLKVAHFMTMHPKVTASVEGHTSNQQGGTAKQDMELSQQRAKHVVDYLVENFGIDRSRLSAVGFGQTRRFAYNTSAEGQQENRRVNIIFNYPDRK
jgi:OOP family OmpA-OmpF porin